MEITAVEENGLNVVSLAGRLDANSSSDVTGKLEPIATDGAKILFDLEAMEYISSAGLRSFLVIAKKVRSNNGKMCLTGLNENVREVFDISGFSSILDICDTNDQAVALLNE